MKDSSAQHSTQPHQHNKRAPTIDYSKMWSLEAQQLKQSALVAITCRFRGVEGVINMSAGLPSPTSFPITSLDAATQPLPLSNTSTQQTHQAPQPTSNHSSSEYAGEAPLFGLASQRQQAWWHSTSTPTTPCAPTPAGPLPVCLPHSTPLTTAHKPSLPSYGNGIIPTMNGTSTHTSHTSHTAPPPSPSVTLHPPSQQHTASCNGEASHGGVFSEGVQGNGVAVNGTCNHEKLGADGHGSTQELTGHVHVSGKLIGDAQQYMFHSGHPPLLQWTRQITELCHAPPCVTENVITSGAVNALMCAISCLCDRGDFIVCEEFAYTHAPECIFIPKGLQMLPVTMDEQGMVPDALRRVLKTAGVSSVTGRPPRVIYIIPSGQNPTGAVMGTERKAEIYEICRSHNLIILEDDAYYWLQYPHGAQPESRQPGLCLPPSLLSMDVDGRVLRIDTFAKLLGPGYRLGWITAAPTLAARMGAAVQASSCGPSSLSQVVVSELVNMWGLDGFEAFVRKQQASYARRAAAAVAAAREHLQGLATCNEPTAGMFMWFKLEGLPDFGPEVLEELVAAKVVVVPGRPFSTNTVVANEGAPCPYFRATFGSVAEEQLLEGFARLGSALRTAVSKAQAKLQ